jgi:predicted GNAT superfamily acetyltransferase
MTYIVPEIALATRGDIVGILDLQEQNLLGRGGLLSVRLPGAFIEAALDDLPQIVARRDGKIVAYLLAGSRSVHAQTPIIKAMFRAYSGSHDAYIYGPICVAESERGHGLATALFAELRERLPERECVAFVRRDNAASLRAHLKMGMKDVASFEHDGVAHAVLAFTAPRRPPPPDARPAKPARVGAVTLAVAPTFPRALRLPGFTLTLSSTSARSMRS